jgi:hypothetical protein
MLRRIIRIPAEQSFCINYVMLSIKQETAEHFSYP